MANPVFSFVYNVRIDKYRREFESEQQEVTYSSDTEVITVMADDLIDAYCKAEEYAEYANRHGVWEFYDVVDAERGEQILLWMDEDHETDDIVEEEIVPQNGNDERPDTEFIAD